MSKPNWLSLLTVITEFKKAARAVLIDEKWIGIVDDWDGKTDLIEMKANLEAQDKMDDDTIPKLSSRVKEVYQKMTPLLAQLKMDPDNLKSLEELEGFNKDIVNGNKAENSKPEAFGNPIHEEQWRIDFNFFKSHYKAILDARATLETDPESKIAREFISTERQLIKEHIEKHHLLEEWNVESLKRSKTKQIEYPWPTRTMPDGSVIIGVRKIGRGMQVLIERAEEDGNLIRILEAASRVGFREVKAYDETPNRQNLAEKQSQYSYKDRDDFKELLWVTKSRGQRQNEAARTKIPAADCCVRFTGTKGIRILTLSSFKKVLGVGDAKTQIKAVCHKDGILPPWDYGYLSSYYNPAEIEKDPVQRRAIEDSQTEALSSRVGETKDNTIARLQLSMDNMNETMKSLTSLVQKLMASPPSKG